MPASRDERYWHARAKAAEQDVATLRAERDTITARLTGLIDAGRQTNAELDQISARIQRIGEERAADQEMLAQATKEATDARHTAAAQRSHIADLAAALEQERTLANQYRALMARAAGVLSHGRPPSGDETKAMWAALREASAHYER